MTPRWSLLALLGLCLAAPARPHAQAPAPPPIYTSDAQTNESFVANIHRDLVQEKVNLGSCTSGLKGVPGCAETLFTGAPFHLAVGSLAPQNGIAAGLAFTELYHPTYCASWLDFTHPPAPGTRNACHWSLNFNADGQASGNASWRAGGYITATRLSSRTPKPHFPGQSRPRHPSTPFSGPSPTVSLYSTSTSLNRLYFYGLGPSTAPGARTDFGLTENVTGVRAVIPLSSAWWLAPAGISLLAELNGRFPSVRGSYGDTSPSIETTYTEASAPGLSAQPSFLQAGEGLSLIPAIPERAHLKINYILNFQQFVATSPYSFRRFTTDLNHTLILYTRNLGKPAPPPPPPLPGQPIRTVPPISPTRDVTGSISARLLIQDSIATAGHAVPFYLDPTLGGSDVNGQSMLPSYPDFRFRAPNLLLIHGAYEQSLGKLPIGLFLAVDEGKVALRRGDIAFDHLRHSYSAGLTIHAGGIPVIYLLFAWGGNEGHHTIVTISDALLGPGSRPSLF